MLRALLVATALALAACTTPATAVLVVLDTDADPARTLRVRVTARAGVAAGALDAGDVHAWTRGGRLGDASAAFPATFGVVPRAGAPRDGTVTLVVEAELEGGAGAEAITFRRVARFAFVPRETTQLPVFLATACADRASGCTTTTEPRCTVSVRCEEQGRTCGDRGECVEVDVAPLPLDAGVVAPDVVRRDAADAPDARDAEGGRDAQDVADAGCAPGATRACYRGPPGTMDVGRCRAGTQRCDASGAWGACAGDVLPLAREVCGDGADDTCDGVVDDGCPTARSCLPTPVVGCGGVEVPGGAFAMGEVGALNGEPVQSAITVSGPFVVDAYEVTVARFRRYWSAGRPTPSGPIAYPNGAAVTITTASVEPLVAGERCTWSAAPGAREAHPLNCVGWETAMAFCAWDGGRLPTEAEQEWVARGRPVAGLPLPRRYAWGDQDPVAVAGGSCDRAHYGDCRGEDGVPTRRVGGFPPSGFVHDLTGNVSEWSADTYRSYTDARCWGGTARVDPFCFTGVVSAHARRSGSFGSTLDRVRSAARDAYAQGYAAEHAGFRCVRAR